jgi:hypothetical protein
MDRLKTGEVNLGVRCTSHYLLALCNAVHLTSRPPWTDFDHGRPIRRRCSRRCRQSNYDGKLHRAFLIHSETKGLAPSLRTAHVRLGQPRNRQADLCPRPHLLLSIWLSSRYAGHRRRSAHGSAAIYVRFCLITFLAEVPPN